ncbi:hypothetical protein ACOMHN_013306 [Nucella lapillus]
MSLLSSLQHHLLHPALLLLVLCLALSSPALQSRAQAASSDHAPSRSAASSLAQLLRARRSAELQAPPHYYAASRLAGYFGSAPSKRDDGYWIWMPAHGYMSVPRDEVASSSGDKDSMGNLLRYGRK